MSFETFKRPQRREWQPWEDGLLANPHLSLDWLVERLEHRSRKAIRRRRAELRAAKIKEDQ